MDKTALKNEFVRNALEEEIKDAYQLFLEMKRDATDDEMMYLSFDTFIMLYRDYSRIFTGEIMVDESLKKMVMDEGVVSIDLDELRRQKAQKGDK